MKLSDEMSWGVKILEQSGIPLALSFIPKFPLNSGCPKGNDCIICNNTGVKCGTKGVIYMASCEWCNSGAGMEAKENDCGARGTYYSESTGAHETYYSTLVKKVEIGCQESIAINDLVIEKKQVTIEVEAAEPVTTSVTVHN